MAVLVQYQHRFDTSAAWTVANPVLLEAEFGLDITNGRYKMGDGVTAWNSLPYAHTRMISTVGVPANSVGVNGDVAVDIAGKVWYGPKANNAWPAGVSLQGPQGIKGDTGSAGAGVPTGGTTGQVLRKNSATNNDTSWATLANASATDAGLMSAAAFIKLRTTGLYYDIVADGGAVADGVTDCRAIIENAHAALAAFGGGVVYYPPVGDVGTGKGYAVSGPITLNGNYVTHRGANSVVSLVKRTFATGDTYVVNGANTQFEDLRIIGASNTLVTSGYAINVTASATNVTIRDCDIIYHWSGIRATGQLCRMIQCNIREMGFNANNGIGILIDSFSDQYIDAVVMDNPVPPWGNAPGGPVGFSGIKITNLSSLQLVNSQIIHCGVAMDVAPTGTNTVPSIHAFNTFFDNSVIGLRLGGAVGSTIVRSNFLQCWFSSCTQAGAVLSNNNIKGVDFIACEFYGNPVGFDVTDATDWSISGRSRISGNTTAGVRVALGTVPHAFTIVDSFIGNGSNFGANAVGISLAAGTYDRIEIVRVRGLDTNTSVGIAGETAALTAEINRRTIQDNMGHGLPAGAIARAIPPVTVPSLLTTEQVVITVRIPPNAVLPGTTFRVRVRGQSGGASVLTGRLKVGAAAGVGTATVVALAASAAQAANSWWQLDFDATVATVGATGTISGGGNGVFQTATVGPATGAYTAPTINTTAAWWLTVTIAQTTAASAQTIRHAAILVDSVN